MSFQLLDPDAGRRLALQAAGSESASKVGNVRGGGLAVVVACGLGRVWCVLLLKRGAAEQHCALCLACG
jgi:hypothetical protein